MTDLREVIARVAQGGPVRPSGGEFMVRCPVHGADGGDTNPSLSIAAGTDQPIVMKCFAGCSVEDILAAVGMSMADISSDDPRLDTIQEWTPVGPAVAIYDYVDEHGDLIWQVLRTADKQFRPRMKSTETKTGWKWRAPEADKRVLYRLPQVIEAIDSGAEIVYCEGEKDVHSLEKVGAVATTSPGGSNSWLPHYADTLRGAVVTIVADKDAAGRALARQVRAAILEAEGRARIVEAAHGKDATDHLRAGGTLDSFVETVPFEEEPVYELAPTLDEYLDNPPGEQRFVVPDLLAEREVLLLTAYEGQGKSTFMKQFAVMVAAGLNPFNGRTIPQRRVLFIDLENPKHDNYSDFGVMRMRLRKKSIFTVGDYLHLLEARAMDVRSSEGLAWLLERVHAHKPELLVIGPIYNMVGSDLKDEDEARALKNAIDLVRERYGCAVLLEHHVPHRNGDIRDLRPIGSSLLMRWPAFGFGLAPIMTAPAPGAYQGQPTGVYQWAPWRGPRRRTRTWPAYLRWGNQEGNSEEWPWELADERDIAEALAAAAGPKKK